MTVLEIGTRVHYHSDPTSLGTITKARIVGRGEDREAEYKVIWDECPEDGACQAWPCEINPLAA
jgi:hypothetical protein